MSFHIKKIKIFNFLSFCGDQGVELEPYTALVCNYDQGKEDFCKAIEFVFGAKLIDFGIEAASELVNPVLLAIDGSLDESFVKECYVEVTLKFVGKPENDLLMSRNINVEKDEIEYRISKELVTRRQYLEKLDALGLNLTKKNLIFYEKFFNDAIWGSEEDLEKVVSECLRKPCLLDDWKKSKIALKRLEKMAKDIADKLDFSYQEKGHSLMSKVVDKYEDVTHEMVLCKRKNSLKAELIKSIVNAPSTESSPIEMSTYSDDLPDFMEQTGRETEKKLRRMSEMEERLTEWFGNLEKYRLNESIALAKLYYREIRMSRKPENTNLIRDRINQIKGSIREEEATLTALWRERGEVEVQLNLISEQISEIYESVNEIQKNQRNQIRLTSYGRLIDHVSPSKNINLLRYVLGEELLYGHLIDTCEEAKDIFKKLKEDEYEKKETFIVFENYKMSHKLKEIILTSDENGINIDTIENLQIFLYKLADLELIPEVPIFAQREYNYSEQETIRKDDTIFTTNFTKNDVMITREGFLTRMIESETVLEDEDDLQHRLNELIIKQEMKYHRLHDLNLQRWKTLTKMSSLEEDISFLKKYSKQTSQRSERTDNATFVPIIYDEYEKFFTEYDALLKKWEGELQESEEYKNFKFARIEKSLTPQSQPSQPYDERFEKIQILQTEMKEMEGYIADIENDLRELCASFLCIKRFPTLGPYIETANLKDKRALCYEAELKSIKKLMRVDEIEEFQGDRDWQKSIFKICKKYLENAQKELESQKQNFKEISKDRKSRILLLEKHCNLYFFQTFQNMLDDVVTMVNFIYNHSEDKLQIITSLREDLINILDFKNLNNFLKFMSVLCLFLMISMSEEIPIMILDNIEEFFPKDAESVKEVLGEELLSKLMPDSQDLHFDLMMRIGEYFSLFLKKNTTQPPIRKTRATQYKNGPSQIIYFSNGDFSLAADHHILIHRKVLPPEFITEKNPHYSTLQPLKF